MRGDEIECLVHALRLEGAAAEIVSRQCIPGTPGTPGTDGREARMEYTGNPGLPPRPALARGLARVLR